MVLYLCHTKTHKGKHTMENELKTLSAWANLYFENGEISQNEKNRLLWEANHVEDDLMDEDLFTDYIFEMRA